MDEHSPTPPALVRLSEGWCPLDGHGRLSTLGTSHCRPCSVEVGMGVSWVHVAETEHTFVAHVQVQATAIPDDGLLYGACCHELVSHLDEWGTVGAQASLLLLRSQAVDLVHWSIERAAQGRA